MKPSILLIGGGGHCKACIDVIEQEGKYEIAGIVEQKKLSNTKVLNYPIIGSDDDLQQLIATYKNVLITIGQIKSAKIRMELFTICKEHNANFPIVISPLAYVSKHAKIKEGTIIMHQATINAEAKIGTNCIINTKALIEHEAKIGDHCHISTAAKINGQVNIGNECFVGSGATLINNINLTEKVIIPAGKTIFKSISKPGIYIKH